MKSYLEKMDEFPPYICMLFARDKSRKRIGVDRIASVTGFSQAKVRRIGKRRSWKNVTVGDAVLFRDACGFSRPQERRQSAYFKRTAWMLRRDSGLQHLRKDPQSKKLLRSLLKKP